MDAAKLKSYVERIERLEEEQAGIGADKKDIFSEAKSHGFNTKVLRRLIRERKRDKADREQEDAELETYRAALDAGVALVKSGLSLRDAAKQSGASKSSIHRALSVPAPSHDAETGEITETQDAGPAGDDARTPEPSRSAEVVSNSSSGPSVQGCDGAAQAAAGPLDPNSDGLDIPPALRRTRAA